MATNPYNNWTTPCLDGSAGTIISATSWCADGFYCPNMTLGELPVSCPPSPRCLVQRLLSIPCSMPQGRLEPIICKAGYYCPDYSKQTICPEGSYCLTGSVAPIPCNLGSSCPQGTTSQTYYLPLVICVFLDFGLLLIWIHGRLIERRRQRESKDLADSSSTTFKFNTSPGLVSAFQRGMDGHVLTVGIEFQDISLLKGGKHILTRVSGGIRSGKLTAIIGPSGAGKTTFLHVLMGKLRQTSGEMRINGKATELHKYRRIVGYVPQEDTMIPELTVRENILHSARIRLPRRWSRREVSDYVDLVIDVLGLTEVAHSLIGDDIKRGISGGQRKRVNIGIELAAVPVVLFLDEPTTGLDSTAALAVVESLKAVSSTLGITIVSVIHQPRSEIFETLDDVLVLGRNGFTSYNGPVADAQPYYEYLGYKFGNGNPADTILDILNEKQARPRNSRYEDGEGLDGLPLQKIILSRGQKTSPPSPPLSIHTPNDGQDVLPPRSDSLYSPLLLKGPELQGEDDVEDFDKIATRLVRERGANFFMQLYYCHSRSMLQQKRAIMSVILEVVVGSVAGLLMAVAAGQSELYRALWITPYTVISPSTQDWDVALYALLVGSSSALAGGPPGTRVFGFERPIMWRETASGHSRLAYFLAKNISFTYRMILSAAHFAAVLHVMATPPIAYSSLFLVIMGNLFGVYGLSIITSLCFRIEDAALAAVIFSMAAAIMCGFEPTLHDAQSWNLEWLWSLSYNRWTAEAMVSEYANPYNSVYITAYTSSTYGYTFNRFGVDIGIAIAIGVGFRLIAFVLMVVTNREKQR
ncbi:hypothetical protein SmJEL517_g04542 [Synchytrium microbalum]|uniref:ABC transporter domain-containing protein n=1 Tax=Synchytrium microbalum TaxID=1806994 RepID=A0A507C436_9FUNG|nr:uncharacterized protein SmJEL517_g04542 [Synchytrium microbalum]TPX32335.1 hypothetical protein SmJEL517_g04542 [Synchytrium microbalum]